MRVLMYYRVITIQAIDGELLEGPETRIVVLFDRTCSVWPSSVLNVPSGLKDYERLGLCTSIAIERLEIVNSMDITSLEFMSNITVSNSCFPLKYLLAEFF